MTPQDLFDDINLFAEVILPLPLPTNYTYGVPKELEGAVTVGKRVEIQFGRKKIYAGIIKSLHNNRPKDFKVKTVLSVLDEKPIVNEKQFQLWNWMTDYYMCYEGEVMNAALPSGFKLESESSILLHPDYKEGNESILSDNEFLVVEALHSHRELQLKEVEKILSHSSTRKVIDGLLTKKVILLKEELQERYRPRKATFIKLNVEFENNEALQSLFTDLEKAPKQLALLMAYLHLFRSEKKNVNGISRSELLKKADAQPSALDGLVKKNIFIQAVWTVDRLETKEKETQNFILSKNQQHACDEVKNKFTVHNTVLLHGVTASGKTNIYIRLMEEEIKKGKQVLYLVPEIALTTQLVTRLQKYFGSRIGVYHSKFNQNERIEIWNKLLSREYDIVLGARSALFLPFENISMVIIDEEHDASFKQQDPAPRYHARDSAIYLASLHQAKTLLGTATPSLESYYNALNDKYGLVTLSERFSGIQLPEIVLVDAKEQKKRKQMKSLFTTVLMEEMQNVLNRKEQFILFQNRRGYAPFIECSVCAWIPQCPNCDVSLTYHKLHNELKCHYCGYRRNNYTKCPACNSTSLLVQGFGTEKIEDELQIYFPELKIGRMDVDAIRTKTGHNKIIHDFEEGKLQAMVGTQMVTKGLDFDKVSLVGIMSADQLINYADFRATERAYQLMEQVAGRAGRKHKRGRVVIQTNNLKYPTLQFISDYDYESFYKWEIAHRSKFSYPPFTRLIKVTLKHKNPKTLSEASGQLANELKGLLGKRLLGPSEPFVSRIQTYHIKELLLKLEKSGSFIHEVKWHLRNAVSKLLEQPGLKSLRIEMDVDPY